MRRVASALLLAVMLAACGGDEGFEGRSRAELRTDAAFAATLDAGGPAAAEAAEAYIGELCDFLASGAYTADIEGSITGRLELTTVLEQARAGATTSFEELRNRTLALRNALIDAAPGPATATYLEVARDQALALFDAIEAADYRLGPDAVEAVQRAGRERLGVAPTADAEVYLGAYEDVVADATEELRTTCGEDVLPQLPQAPVADTG